MSNPDFVPSADADFNVFQAGVVSDTQTNATAWGILAADITALVALQLIWTNAYAKASNKQNRTTADVQAKNDARANYEKALRKFIAQWLSNNPKVPDAERQRMGLTIKSGAHTAVGTPTSSPIATVDFSTRLQHALPFVDENTPTTKAKPDGVHGCEIWIKLGNPAPVNDSELSFLGVCTRSPYTVSFKGDDAGKTAYYWLRWVNSKGQQGPWSSPVNAMVVG